MKKLTGFPASLMHAGGSPAASSFSCAAKKRNQKKAAPVSRPLSGVPLVLPDSTRRLRNSTRQGTHNVPCHGTRTVLADCPLSIRAARHVTRGNLHRCAETFPNR